MPPGPDQTRIFWEAQAAWYVTLVMCQFWHIWTVRRPPLLIMCVRCVRPCDPASKHNRLWMFVTLDPSPHPSAPLPPPSHATTKQCKTRQVSIFRHGVLRNAVTLFGVAISLGTILVVVYVPFLQVGAKKTDRQWDLCRLLFLGRGK